MCLAVPGKIISIKDDSALVDFKGIKKKINITLVKVKKGDYVIVHAGFAIQRLTKENTDEIFEIYETSKKDN